MRTRTHAFSVPLTVAGAAFAGRRKVTTPEVVSAFVVSVNCAGETFGLPSLSVVASSTHFEPSQNSHLSRRSADAAGALMPAATGSLVCTLSVTVAPTLVSVSRCATYKVSPYLGVAPKGRKSFVVSGGRLLAKAASGAIPRRSLSSSTDTATLPTEGSCDSRTILSTADCEGVMGVRRRQRSQRLRVPPTSVRGNGELAVSAASFLPESAPPATSLPNVTSPVRVSPAVVSLEGLSGTPLTPSQISHNRTRGSGWTFAVRLKRRRTPLRAGSPKSAACPR